ncbi:MAG: hypothetical protein IJL20_13040 [Lachnospiraceae bacterium]|nr:hypothetical protein [Lachnospiraceae bacterium]MBR3580635.1 hypothetical protein [Lachnospiraceae bacterium]
MVIKSVNETLYGVNTNISGSKNVKRVVVESGDTLNAIQSGSINIDGDTFELSDEVRKAIKEAFDKSMEENAKINEMNAAAHNMVVAEQQGDVMKSVMEDQAKAIEIANIIAKGGQVPPGDEAFLLENNPDMYKLAKLSAMQAKEHEKYETVLEEKEQKEYDYEKGHDNTMHRVAVDISTGESGAEITGVSEVSVEKTSD